jgi:hypothetical protein
MGEVNAALVVGGFCLLLSFLALTVLPETFGRDLHFVEEENEH